jgi:hypothetical protein
MGVMIIWTGLVGMLAVGIRFERRADRAGNAWAYAKPSLTGNWQGEAWAGNTQIKLAIALTRDESDRVVGGNTQDSHRSLSGRAIICDSTGRAQSYSVAGIVEDSRGREARLTFSPPAHETPGLRPGSMKLTWNGGTTLNGQAELVHAKTEGETWFSSSDPETAHPVPFQLHSAASAVGTCGVTVGKLHTELRSRRRLDPSPFPSTQPEESE